MTNRYFTLEEAQGYVIWLADKFEAIEALRNKIIDLKEKIQNLQNGINLNGGGSVVEQISNSSRELDDISKLVDENIQSVHEKGILTDKFTLDGSMNFTYRGVNINQEYLGYRCDPSVVHERKLTLEERWRGQY